MERIRLKAKELLVLSSQIGAENFYGISDPFFGMSREDVWREVPNIQRQLEEKKLISLGFDDSVRIDDAAKAIISVCALCEKYLSVSGISLGEILPKRLLYIKGDALIELQEEGQDVSLHYTTPEGFVSSVMESVFAACDDKVHTEEPIQVHQDILVRAQSAGLGQSQQILQAEAFSQDMAAVVTNGFNQTGQYCMVTAIDLTKNTLCDFVCIIGDAGSVQIDVADEFENLWKISWVTKSGITRKLQTVIQQLTCTEVHTDETL